MLCVEEDEVVHICVDDNVYEITSVVCEEIEDNFKEDCDRLAEKDDSIVLPVKKIVRKNQTNFKIQVNAPVQGRNY